MKLDFERHGGFTGIPLRVSVDTDSLPKNQADELQALVTAANFWNQPAKIIPSTSAATDQFTYQLTVKENGQQHTVETEESFAPATMRPLLDYLTKLARSNRS